MSEKVSQPLTNETSYAQVATGLSNNNRQSQDQQQQTTDQHSVEKKEVRVWCDGWWVILQFPLCLKDLKKILYPVHQRYWNVKVVDFSY